MPDLIETAEVPPAGVASRGTRVRFCTHCGKPAQPRAEGETAAPPARVCHGCGMGVLLTCAGDGLPGAGAAFLIADAGLKVTAISVAAELLFGAEGRVVGSNLLALMGDGDGGEQLRRTVARAAIRWERPSSLPVHPTSGLGADSSLSARISTCGPPRGALVALEHR